MGVALISDIHGNLTALEAVVSDIEREAPDHIVCLGDVALAGPQPRETVERVKTLGCLVVMGNCEEWMLNPQPYDAEDEDSRLLRDVDFWSAEQLSPADVDYIGTFEETIEVPLGDGRSLLCFHGSPKSNEDFILSTTPDEDLDEMLAGYHATVMIGGHTHSQMLRRYGESVLVNAGSVGGLPEEERGGGKYNPPWAEYVLLGVEGGRLSIEFRRVPVDVGEIRSAALRSGMPHAEWWASRWMERDGAR